MIIDRFNNADFLVRISDKYRKEFREKIAYENALRMGVLFYFFLVFFVLFLVLDFRRYAANKAGDPLYALLFVSHLIYIAQLFYCFQALRNRKKIKANKYPPVIKMERKFMWTMVIAQLPMGILGIFERETLVVVTLYAVMLNIVMQLGHRKNIIYNVGSFLLTIVGMIWYYNSSYNLPGGTEPLIMSMELLGIYSVPFFISRRQYNGKVKEFEYQHLLAEQNEIILAEKKKSDDLLLNILPKEVAEELKETGHSEAHLFDNVSVLFSDFVNFTQLSETLSPSELVAEIHSCFKEFDDITDRYGLEKIKTIGDAYLAVSGMPIEEEFHARQVIMAALEMRDFIAIHKADNIAKGKPHLDIRIGIHSGPVIAGIVGVKKFAYDIWGDTVNMAARMEQHSRPGKVNISDTTYQIVKDKFKCHARGMIAAKNKGKIKMYFVEHTKD